MGEAKRRKASDPDYGKAEPSARGLIISPPLIVESGGSIHIKSSELDPQELRFALLFWDQLAWPDNNVIGIGGGSDADFLLASGVLTRPRYAVYGTTNAGSAVLNSYVQAYRALNQSNPGRWSVSQGENSLLIEGGLLIPGRGALVELHRAIPVPNADVPLEDILDFKMKRQDELLALRDEIDSLYSALAQAGDKEFELARLAAKIDRACADVLRLGKERQFGMRYSDLKASFDFDVGKIAGWAIAGETAGQQLALPIVGAALGGVAATLKLGWDSTASRAKFGSHPYRYVYRIHDDLL
jgi:Family of unknown function (DUF6236)